MALLDGDRTPPAAGEKLGSMMSDSGLEKQSAQAQPAQTAHGLAHLRQQWRSLKRRTRFLLIAVPCIILAAAAIGMGVGFSLDRPVGPLQPVSTHAPVTGSCTGSSSSAVNIPLNPPNGAGTPMSAFVSLGIEYLHFPYFGGNHSQPNDFSNNLLKNIGDLQGSRPYFRVGGNSQDRALWNPNLKVAVTRPPSPTDDVHISESYFESFQALEDTKFVYGFNMAQMKGAKSDDAWNTMVNTVPLACKAIGAKNLAYWEYGNEPDLYPVKTNNKAAVRIGKTWNNQLFASQWQNGTNAIKDLMKKACPDMVGDDFGFVAPSLWKPDGSLSLNDIFKQGLDSAGDVKAVSLHNYMGAAEDNSLTLAGTLMSHGASHSAIAGVVAAYRAGGKTDQPLVITEANSLSNVGRAGTTDVFGAALWNMDYLLTAAQQGVKRMHMQQGLNFLYNAWQPVDSGNFKTSTKPPYYGMVAAAAFLGNLDKNKVSVSAVDLGSGHGDHEAAYAAYEGQFLKRVAVLNMKPFSQKDSKRGKVSYSFKVPKAQAAGVQIRRLMGKGMDDVEPTWDGYSYRFDLAKGRPSLVKGAVRGEQLRWDGCGDTVGVDVPDSSAVVLEFF